METPRLKHETAVLTGSVLSRVLGSDIALIEIKTHIVRRSFNLACERAHTQFQFLHLKRSAQRLFDCLSAYDALVLSLNPDIGGMFIESDLLVRIVLLNCDHHCLRNVAPAQYRPDEIIYPIGIRSITFFFPPCCVLSRIR